MTTTYDQYYKNEDYFGGPSQELIDFFQALPERGRVLDVGCGQGRNALPLARMGFAVSGVDSSRVGIDQMNKQAQRESLRVKSIVGDLYDLHDFAPYSIILLDSMFHFAKPDKR